MTSEEATGEAMHRMTSFTAMNVINMMTLM